MTAPQGFWPDRWQPLAEAFAANFADCGEEGAALAVVQGGDTIASLWAGTRDRAQAEPWQEDTAVNIFSAGKPLVAAAVLTLVDAGKLDLNAPIARYWPAFAANGKESITTAQILHHTSGLSAFHPRVKEPVIYDTALVRELIEYESPWWEPGSQQGYSPFLYGWILAELVRRISDCDSFAQYFQQVLAGPLGMSAYFGVPKDLQARLAEVAPLKKAPGRSGAADSGAASPGASSAELGQLMKQDPRGVTNRAFTNPITLMNSTNTEAWRSAEIPAANCHANALSLARFYDALLGNTSPLGASLQEAIQEQSAAQDAVLGVQLRFGQGFMLSQSIADCRFGSAAGFGHPGAGGSVAFADPDAGLGFGYVTARMGQSVLIDRRAQTLISALYRCL